jgi:uncharacterized RDD family membrane protein YckC
MTCPRRVSTLAALLLVAFALPTSSLFAVETTPAMVVQRSQTTPSVAPQDNTKPTQQSVEDLRRQAVLDQWEREYSGRRWRRSVLRVGQDYLLPVGQEARNVTVVFGRATVEGRVSGDLVVIMGSASLGPAAIVEGSFVVVGGDADVSSGALVRDDVVTIGAGLNAPTDFRFGGEHIVFGTLAMERWFQASLPWVRDGLLWGRPVVFSIGWVWTVLLSFFAVYFLLNIVLHAPVAATADVLNRRPFGSFMTGLLMLVLTAPLIGLLAVTVVGIVVVPFVIAALVVAAFVGRVGVMRWIGQSIMPVDDAGSRLLAVRSFVIGATALVLIYAVPLLGLVAWALVGMFGFGAAIIAFLAAWRQESPKKTNGEMPTWRNDKMHQGHDGVAAPPASSVPPPAPMMAAAPVPPLVSAVPPAVPPPPVSPAPPAAPPRVAGSLLDLPRATFLERAAAFLVDALLVALAYRVLDGLVFPRYSDFYLPMLLIYFIGFWAWKGTTLGGTVINLRIVKLNGQPLEPGDAIVRGLAGILSFAALGIGVLWILKDADRQAWHDKAVGTVVVKDPSTRF